jgi:hypothetical protein
MTRSSIPYNFVSRSRIFLFYDLIISTLTNKIYTNIPLSLFYKQIKGQRTTLMLRKQTWFLHIHGNKL